MSFQDQTLKCRDCGKEFVFTAGDQDFFAKKGFTNAPTRCKDCRNLRKKSVEAAANRPVFKIKCKQCGKEGEMATEPRKPEDVMCSECFYASFKSELENQGHTFTPEPASSPSSDESSSAEI